MARIEDILNNWKWDEEKIRKYLEEFENYLNSEKGQNEVKNIRKRVRMAQELLKDEESIENLTNEKLSDLFAKMYARQGERNPFYLKIKNGDEEYIKEIKTYLKELIKINPEDQLPEKKPEGIGIAYVTELLTLRNPEEFYLINSSSIEGINNLATDPKDQKLPPIAGNQGHYFKFYPKFKQLFDYLKERIKPIIEKNLNKKVDYYDVDLFLYFIKKQSKKSKKDKIEESKAINEEKSNSKKKVGESDPKNELTLHKFFQYKGFYFDEDLITAFYAAIKTKGFVIFSGPTGTGKTKLAQLFAELLCPKCNLPDKQNTKIAQVSSKNQNQCDCTHLFLSVRPDWRDSKALLGYYNPITKEYQRTPLLDFILKAKDDYKKANKKANPYFIILDEMNLSHVEYYFADFLSVLESGRDENYWTKETIKLHNSEDVLSDNSEEKFPKEIKLPPNLYIIGSVNIDETTYMFSPKVLDRAFTIEFWDVDFDNYIFFNINNEKVKIKIDEDKADKADKAKKIAVSIHSKLLEDLRNKKTKSENNKQNNDQVRFCGVVGDKEEIKDALKCIKDDEKNKVRSGKSIFDELKELNQILQLYDLHFGYRVLDEIALFIKYAMNAPNEVGQLSPEKALDFAVLMKVLPKFHGPRQKLEKPLWLVLNWCLENSVKYENKTFEDLIKEIWEKLSPQDKRPSIEGFTRVIQELKFKLNNRSENVHKNDNPGSQPIEDNQNKTTDQTQEPTSEPNQTEQTNKDEKKPIIDNIKYPRTALKVLRMLRQLYETGFASFA